MKKNNEITEENFQHILDVQNQQLQEEIDQIRKDYPQQKKDNAEKQANQFLEIRSLKIKIEHLEEIYQLPIIKYHLKKFCIIFRRLSLKMFETKLSS